MLASHPVASMLVEYPAFLQVWYLDFRLYVYVSINVWLDEPEFNPALLAVAALGGILTSEAVIVDRDMMGGSARLFAYNTAREPVVTQVGKEFLLAS